MFTFQLQSAPAMPTWEVILLSVVPMVASLAAAVGTFLNGRSIKDIHISINSRMDQLLKSSVGEAHASGKADGLVEGRVAGINEGKRTL